MTESDRNCGRTMRDLKKSEDIDMRVTKAFYGNYMKHCDQPSSFKTGCNTDATLSPVLITTITD